MNDDQTNTKAQLPEKAKRRSKSVFFKSSTLDRELADIMTQY